MKALFVLSVAFVLTACMPDETVSAFADAQAIYRLESIGDAPYAAEATISFPEKGRVVGKGPCNSYAAEQTAFYPWFGISPIRATRAACPELRAEGAFFEALMHMRLAEVLGDVLILTGEDDRQMVFRRQN